MKKLILIVLPLLNILIWNCTQTEAIQPSGWVGIHLLNWTSDSLLTELGKNIPDLAKKGVNLIILEVDYSFEFQSHPELRQGEKYITRKMARQFKEICREYKIRLVPEFQCLGHQSWAKTTFPLLTKYPELDISPGAFPDNDSIYCREWDPTNPRVNEIVFPLIDEIVEAFDSDGIHIGMDEVFLLDSDESPNTKGKNPAKLFARVVNEFHDHFVKEKGLQMFMWGDRLIDGNIYKYGEWESSLNNTASAVDMIPRDIVICDWHYNAMDIYPSVPMFIEKGFKVLPSSYRTPDAVEALIKYSYSLEHPNMVGHLFTTWSALESDKLQNYKPLLVGIQTIMDEKFFDVTFKLKSISPPLIVALSTVKDQLDIFYTIDGTVPGPKTQLYEKPLKVEQNTLLKAVAYKDGTPVSEVTEKEFIIHKAIGKPISLSIPASEKYPSQNGTATLINGVTGSISYADGQWVGVEGTDLEALIDLGESTEITSISMNSINSRPNWVHQCNHVEIFGSNNSRKFQKIGETFSIFSDNNIVPIDVSFKSVKIRYIKVLCHNQLIPDGYNGAGNPAWMFIDEIIVK
jgi:hypothetical protein